MCVINLIIKKQFLEIAALLQKSEKQLGTIKDSYNQSLTKKEVSEELKVDIKNFFENLRSALDFLAHAIHDKYVSCGRRHNIYFPVRGNFNGFRNAVRQSLHDLEAKQPQIYEIIKRTQPYYSEENIWISNFFKLCNLKKHVALTEQTKVERHEVRVSAKGNIVGWDPNSVTYGQGVSILGSPVNPKTQMPEPHPDHKIDNIIWVGFIFDEIKEDALPFMEKVLDKVKIIISNIKKEVI
ncbi:MAG: hypothetical protein KJ983_00150 [Candidatus Omnitrophica bacterium]|nr:hypothetical protein [Candidatus Omnitrophota bacterium]